MSNHRFQRRGLFLKIILGAGVAFTLISAMTHGLLTNVLLFSGGILIAGAIMRIMLGSLTRD